MRFGAVGSDGVCLPPANLDAVTYVPPRFYRGDRVRLYLADAKRDLWGFGYFCGHYHLLGVGQIKIGVVLLGDVGPRPAAVG